MKNSNQFSIGFWLKKTAKKSDGQIPIYVRIRFEKQRSDLSVHRTALENHGCTSSGKVHHRFKEAKSINMYLDDIQAKLLDCHRQLMARVDKNVTFHLVRHTFATTITLMNDVPIKTVSKLLGHTKLSTTQKYARVVEKKISKDMSKLKEALNGSKDGGQTLESESAVATTHNRKGHLRVNK